MSSINNKENNSLPCSALKRKSFIQTFWDFLGIPFRLVLFDQKWLPAFYWTTLEDDRLREVIPEIKGRLLDIGAGENTLVKLHENGEGVDVFDWGGGALVVENTADLPFDSGSFDSVTFVACLNHIPNREEVVKEADRLLKDGGNIIVTMINPFIGDIGHKIWWYSEDKHRGGMIEGELGGMWTGHIVQIFEDHNFQLTKHKRFVYGMNHLYVFERKR